MYPEAVRLGQSASPTGRRVSFDSAGVDGRHSRPHVSLRGRLSASQPCTNLTQTFVGPRDSIILSPDLCSLVIVAALDRYSR